MNKQTWIVPRGIRYLSEWEEFQLPSFPCIIDKKVTGCGFTEYVINAPFNAILVSPRKVLLENKSSQHNPTVEVEGEKYEIPDQRVIYYAQSDWEEDLAVDKDLEKREKIKEEKVLSEEEAKAKFNIFRDKLVQAVSMFTLKNRPIKISVTYDSFRKVKDILQELGIFDTFRVVIDEFQSIFMDSTFKPDTELEFVNALQGVQKVSYVSATPMVEEYLDIIKDFKNLPYLELDWVTEDKSRVRIPSLSVDETKNINKVFRKYIDEYRKGIFAKKVRVNKDGTTELVEAKELVFYVNSVKNISDGIKQNKLKPWETHIICADTRANRRKIREAFRASLRATYGKDYLQYLPGDHEVISKVPTPDPVTGEVDNRPFMFCTKTVYLGADMYSKCARTIIVSDANIDSLMVDVTLDLPQIMGRQRDEDNPWKYEAEVWVKFGMKSGKITPEQFEAKLQEKIRLTKSLLITYDASPTNQTKHDLVAGWLRQQKSENYKYNYVGVNQHAGSDLLPQQNDLVWISEKRAFDIQQVDYADRFAMFNRVEDVLGKGAIKQSSEILDNLDQYSTFSEKMRRCCWYINNGYSIDSIPEQFKIYIQVLGVDFIISKSGRKSLLDEAIEMRTTSRIFTPEDLKEVVCGYFKEGERYSMNLLKLDLGEIYKQLGISKKAKANDIEEWFEVKRVNITDQDTKKRIPGFELIKRK